MLSSCMTRELDNKKTILGCVTSVKDSFLRRGEMFYLKYKHIRQVQCIEICVFEGVLHMSFNGTTIKMSVISLRIYILKVDRNNLQWDIS